jgi:hypothetical protein
MDPNGWPQEIDFSRAPIAAYAESFDRLRRGKNATNELRGGALRQRWKGLRLVT